MNRLNNNRPKVIRKGDEGYELARRNWDPWTSLYPQYIVYANKHRDIINVIRYCKNKNIPLRIRSGGHSLGRDVSSVNNGLIVDISAFDYIKYRPNYIKVGAGINVGNFVKAIVNKGYAFPFGDAEIGLGGLTLGGGIGLTNKQLGLCSDNILGVKMITSNGKIVNCNQDLLWASKGGGGGNFGIVTEFKVKYNSAPIDVFLLKINWTNIDDMIAHAVISFWLNTIDKRNDDLCTSMQINRVSMNGKILFNIEITGLGYGNKCRYMAWIKSRPYKINSNLVITKLAYNKLLDNLLHPIPLSRENYRFTSFWGKSPLTDSAVAKIIKYLTDNNGDSYFLDMGRQFSKIHPRETSFYWRKAKYYFELSYIWTNDNSNDQHNYHVGSEKLRKIRRSIKSETFGSYVNVPDNNLKDYEKLYYGNNINRLRRIKKLYDPEDFFNFSQSIKL